MDTLVLSQWQFAITCIYHFFFVPLTLGLSILVAIMETVYVRTGNEVYKRMTLESFCQPKIHRPRKVDSRKKASRASIARGAPKMSPT